MLGFFLVLVAAVFFCVQNLIVRVLFTEQTLLGLWPTGGFVAPALRDSLLLLWMRMLIVVPLMASLAQKLHPAMWRDIAGLGRRRSLLIQSLVSGFLMFLYLLLLYIAVGLIPTGVALTLFFTYPVFTALMAGYWFRERLTVGRWGIMGLIIFGSALTLPQSSSGSQAPGLGSLLAVASGFAYAGYTVLAQKTVAELHPAPFTWLSFATTLVLSGGCLLCWPESGTALPWMPLWIGAGGSALVTFLGHLLNNSGIGLIGASQAAMIGASNPALTSLFAWLVFQEQLTVVQTGGVILVTLSVILLSRGFKASAQDSPGA
ncbi:MAG: DMT family transporter [Cyanobacteriota bacterium]|jgi:drug/metabolite transporter (DMT)-like permease